MTFSQSGPPSPGKGVEFPLMLRALRGEATERTPIWLMRQAGRSDPAYRALRDRCPLPLEELFQDVERSVEISLLPKRIGVDGIIFFQDILTPLAPMGARFVFRPGPVLEHPVRNEADVERLVLYEIISELPFVGKTLSVLRGSLGGEVPLLGFAGAPFTLLCFLVEGRSPGQGEWVRRMLNEAPALAHRLLAKLTEVTTGYLRYQIESGAQAVQLFESCADLPDLDQYLEFALPYQQEVFSRIESRVPRILFSKGFSHLAHLKESGADVLSLTSGCTIAEAREQIGEEVALQGNVSNRLLAEGPPSEVEAAVRACISSGGHRGHVLNLDHGLLQNTPWEHVELMVSIAHQHTVGSSSPQLHAV